MNFKICKYFIWKRIWNWVQQLIQNITIRKKGMEPIDEIWIIYSCKKAEKNLTTLYNGIFAENEIGKGYRLKKSFCFFNFRK